MCLLSSLSSQLLGLPLHPHPWGGRGQPPPLQTSPFLLLGHFPILCISYFSSEFPSSAHFFFFLIGNHLPLQRGCLNFGKFCLKKSVRNRPGEGLFHRLPPAWAKAPWCQPVRGWSCGFSLSFRGFHLDSFLSFHPYQLPFPPEKASEGGDLSPLE